MKYIIRKVKDAEVNIPMNVRQEIDKISGNEYGRADVRTRPMGGGILGKYKKFGVAWASLGMVSVEEAKQFVKDLNKVIAIAEQANSKFKEYIE